MFNSLLLQISVDIVPADPPSHEELVLDMERWRKVLSPQGSKLYWGGPFMGAHTSQGG